MKQAKSSKWSKISLNLPPNIAYGQKYSIKLSLLKDDKGVSVDSITKVDIQLMRSLWVCVLYVVKDLEIAYFYHVVTSNAVLIVE